MPCRPVVPKGAQRRIVSPEGKKPGFVILRSVATKDLGVILRIPETGPSPPGMLRDHFVQDDRLG